MAGRLAGSGGQSSGGGGYGFWEKDQSRTPSPSDIDYNLAKTQKDLTWDRFKPLRAVGSPDIENYDYKVDLDLNRQGFQDYNNTLKQGVIK